MTKLKNTKKGMAKKALSVSLVAAMLATSNVPVWAAEDLFTDGSASVEVPAVTEPTTDVELFNSGDINATTVEEAPSATTTDTLQQNGDLSIEATGEKGIDINSASSGVKVASSTLTLDDGKTFNINWYHSSDNSTLNYTLGQTYSNSDTQASGTYQMINNVSGPVTGNPGELLTDEMDKETAKTYLDEYITAVVWEQSAQGWIARAVSAPVLVYSNKAMDYDSAIKNMYLNCEDTIKAGDTITLEASYGKTVKWYKNGSADPIGEGSTYSTKLSDAGEEIYPVVEVQTDNNGTLRHSFDSIEVWGVDYQWDFKGETIENGGVAYDAGLLSVKVNLPRALKNGETAQIELTGQTGTASVDSLNGSGNILNGSYTLTKEDIGKTITAKVTIKIGNKNFEFTDSINITDAYVTLTGKPVIKVATGEAEIRPGVTLTADTANVSAPSDPNFDEFSYQWQWYNAATGKWEELNDEDPDNNASTYLVDTDDYGKTIRVAVFGGVYYNADKSVFSDEVTVVADDLDQNKVTVVVDTDANQPGNQDTKVFNPLDSEANKLGNSIKVYYDNNELTAGTDYTLKYSGIDQIGKVTVTVTILPTAKTENSSGSKVFADLYELVSPAENPDFTIKSSDTTSEYNGQAVSPSVEIRNKNGAVIDATEYTVYSVGPDAGTYDINVYVNGQGMATRDGQQHTITPKNINNHEEDFNLVIPDAVWEASEGAVESNTVKDAKIQLFDNAISATEDLLSDYTYDEDEEAFVDESGDVVYKIEVLNWGEGGVKKAIRISFEEGNSNYKGTLVVDGEINSRSIAQFQAQFTTKIRSEAGARVYNGLLQDVLGEILDESHGSITFTDGTRLYEGRDFEYQIVKGGTDAGDVSIYIEGKGNYDGNMTLSNVYTISKANFRDDVVDSDNFTISYDPSLGDAGADISAYVELAKEKYTATIEDSGYKLTLGKDFWLDRVSVGSLNNTLAYVPTVAENKVEGHGENANFVTTGVNANGDKVSDKDTIYVSLVDKDLNDSDIQVTIESAEYNGGNLVTPTVKVAYVKDGQEYIINPAYYDVQIIQSAYDQGETGKVNIVAKDNLNTQQYPQLYTGNKMVDYTVGTTNLALGSIVATNGLTTLPSVAYDSAQAGTETGIILETSKYVVKDASGNIVDPKYYTVSFTNNKAVGTATITVTGKAPYEGSISADFTITQNNLPSGTVTLMSDNLSKVYTGEGVELIKGTDYNITGELASLTEGTDYMIVYEDNINVTNDTSKAAFKVVGINNYAGEVVKYFDITPATITESDITIGDAVYQGGVAVQPAVTVGIPGGNATLTEGTDYTVSYQTTATNAGDEGTVRITYADNPNINTADSVKEVKYTVTAKDLKDVTIQAIADQEATGEQLKPELTVMNGSVQMVEGRDYTVSYGSNTEVGLGTVTIQPVQGNANYTGSQEATFNIVEAQPEVGQAMISEVKVSGNTLTPILAEEVDGAVGYDYVLATEEDYSNGRVDISKNILTTNTNFYYVEAGTYYVYCHAWKRDENGIKQFGEWSNLYKVEVTATTPERPMIQSARLRGNTLTVTWSRSADADGYDIVMGKAARKVNNEMRPVDYGKAVKKITDGDTVTVTFRNIPSGTYYVGLHAWNRTSESGVKVFSPWSNGRKVVVK